MYGHAFKYVVFYLHLLECIYLKLDFFQCYSKCVMSLNIANFFLH